MATNFIPDREADLVTWSTNFDTLITAAPTTYGLTAAQATAYATKHSAFVAAYQTASDPATRSPSNIVAKDTAKLALVAEARMLARIVQATPSVTAQQKSDLGLTVRDAEPSPIPPPAVAPGIVIVSVSGHTVRVRLQDVSAPTNRGKPAGVSGATVLSYVGDAPPADAGDWKFEGNTGRTVFDVEFPPAVAAGSKVWLTAFWFNPRKQSGPAATPASAYVQFGGVMAA